MPLIGTAMNRIINHLRETFTLEYKDSLFFRVEIFHMDTGEDVQVGGYFAEVYMLRFPEGTIATNQPKTDSSFKQHWMYLDDFPQCEGGGPRHVEATVLVAIEKYANDYMAKFTTKSKRQTQARVEQG